MVGACVDNDERVNFETAGEHQSCADLASFCEDDSDLVEQGAPEGWLHEVCAATCGLCDAGAAYLLHPSPPASVLLFVLSSLWPPL